VRGSSQDVTGEHELLRLLWEADLRTAASIRSGRPEAEHDFSADDDDAAAAFQRGLLPSTRDFGRDLADAIDVPRGGAVLDVGGGPGGALLSLGSRDPQLQLTLLELPAVARLVRPMLAASELGARVSVEDGNILVAPARGRHDLVILKAVVQVLSPEEAAVAIRHCFESLQPGGTIVMGGAGMLDDSLRAPPTAVFYNLTFMNLYRNGRSYPRSAYLAWLADAGFVRPRFVTLSSGSTILCAERPD
jgi:trans-aconitate methyltransferase